MNTKDTSTTAPAAIESPVVFEFTNEAKQGVRLHQDGKVTYNGYEADAVSKELIDSLLPHFALLQQLRQVVDNAIKTDLKGIIRLVTADEKNLDNAEIIREHLCQANRQVTIRERAAAEKKAGK